MEKAEATAQFVREEVNSNLFLKETLKRGLVNYSELARQMLPRIKRQNTKANVASIIIALQRYYESSKHEKTEYERFTEEQLPKIELIIKNKVITLTYERNKKVMNTLIEISKSIRWDSGDIMYFIQGTNEIAVIVDKKNESKFDKIKSSLLEKKEDLATLSVREPEGLIYSKEVTGFLALFCSVLADNNVNIYECATTFKQIIFVLHEKEVTKAYEAFNKLSEHYKK